MALELSELKLVSASNIIKLRTGAGLTQAELGAKLNYSDKTISKWERGEAIPDAYVLCSMAELFGVSVDYILSSHDGWVNPDAEGEAAESEAKGKYSADKIIALTIISVWTLSLAVFVGLWLSGLVFWQTFIITLPVSILTYLVLICVFKRTKHLAYVISAFVLSLFVLLYCFLPLQRPWQIFLVAVPAVAIVFLSCNLRAKPREKAESGAEKA